jgi:predicted RNA-binding Zn ribbon-like protein
MAATFQLLGGHPTLEFINTLDNRFVDTGPTELLSSYEDLLSFVEQAKVLEARQIQALRKKGESSTIAAVLQRAYELREALASVFYGIAELGKPAPATFKRLEKYLVEAQGHRELAWREAGAKDNAGFRAVWVWGRFETDLALPLWALTQAAVDLLFSTAMVHVHACASPTCRWLFLDSSKNHSRRWCDMALCGNRMKARRFHERE